MTPTGAGESGHHSVHPVVLLVTVPLLSALCTVLGVLMAQMAPLNPSIDQLSGEAITQALRLLFLSGMVAVVTWLVGMTLFIRWAFRPGRRGAAAGGVFAVILVTVLGSLVLAGINHRDLLASLVLVVLAQPAMGVVLTVQHRRWQKADGLR